LKYLITGGCGFLGSNLAAEALQRGEDVVVADNLSRVGATSNREWLKSLGLSRFTHLDMRSFHDVVKVVDEWQPDRIFHLAGQVAMTTSLDNPRYDFEINVVGGHNLLEAVRQKSPHSVVVYSSTNKVYGDLNDIPYTEGARRYTADGYPLGFDESLRLEFCSPYGCSKGAVDQYMLDYARMFGLNTVVFRHSSIFGGRQFSSYDQGWIGWFIQQAHATKLGRLAEPFTISGDGKQVRDVLFVSDIVDCYFAASDHIASTRGEAFNIGGGAANSLSLLELFDILEQELSVRLAYRRLPWRASDQKVFVADTGKAKRRFGWSPRVEMHDGLRQMIQWVTRHD
jgi:CDP-paratose 2-epimerase